MDSTINNAIAAMNTHVSVHVDLWQKSSQIWMDQVNALGRLNSQLVEDLATSGLDLGAALNAWMRHGVARGRVNLEANRKHIELARHTLFETQETLRAMLPAQARDVLAGPEPQIAEVIYAATEGAVERVDELAGQVESAVEANWRADNQPMELAKAS